MSDLQAYNLKLSANGELTSRGRELEKFITEEELREQNIQNKLKVR